MQNACTDRMVDSAYAVMLPVIAVQEGYLKTRSVGDYGASFAKVKGASMLGLKIIEVRICGPLKNWLTTSATFHPGSDTSQEVDFDDPQNVEAKSVPKTGSEGNPEMLHGYERTKLKVQLKYYHKMIIPFANWVIFRTWTGQSMVQNMRMGTNVRQQTMSWDKGLYENGNGKKIRPDAESQTTLILLSKSQRYYLPLYANYTFRMQSNFYLKSCPLPTDNKCWHYTGSGNGP